MEKVPFFNGELGRDNIQSEMNGRAYDEVLNILNSPDLMNEIQQGNVTLAMIRPNVGPEANLLGLPDGEAADEIEDMIQGLGVLAKFSFVFTKEGTEEFYEGGPEASMSKESPVDANKYSSRWPEFVDFMTSGPTTVLLLNSNRGDAVPVWRSHLGHWNIDEVRDDTTIRGILGVNKYNNLVHGSDSPEAIVRELNIIKKCLIKN